MTFTSIQNALYYAADNGAKIISMSLGAAISSDSATDAAILYAYNAGCTILAATGNENKTTISYPAINANVIGVGAASPCGDRKRSSSSSSEVNPGVSTDPNGYTCDGERWWGSNYGTTTAGAAGAVDVIAPTILPTTDLLGADGYDASDYSKWFNGTSCATPYAAGVCALIKSTNPIFTPAQIKARLTSTAQDVTSVESGAGWDRYAGYGMVDAAAAVAGGTPPTDVVTVTYPNGGETLTAATAVNITWTWTGIVHDGRPRLLHRRRHQLDGDHQLDAERRLAGLDRALVGHHPGPRPRARRHRHRHQQRELHHRPAERATTPRCPTPRASRRPPSTSTGRRRSPTTAACAC